MNRRRTALAALLAVCLAAPQAAALATSAEPGPQASQVDDTLRRLEADARVPVKVHRDERGRADSVRSANGRAMVAARGTTSARRTAADQLARYGKAFGIDGKRSRAVVDRTIGSATGGAVVRADQVVDGLPVFGGQMVLSLDKDQGVVSIDAATTDAIEVPAPVVSEGDAQGVALRVIAKTHRIPTGKLTVTGLGRQLYDPALVHTFDPRGTRPVWRFEVTHGLDVRETVLVGTAGGEVALHFNDAPGLDRAVCDNHNDHSVLSSADVPLCTAPVRSEGQAPTGTADVDAAYDNLGAVSDAYQALDGIDLTELVGVGTAGSRQLQSTVRWCYADDVCPFDNAFWDGTQMVFGQGYAGADDVVGHELTHGYVERTSGLFAFHQSGAVNESLADVVGEVVDHRTGAEDDSAWTMGEDLPNGGAVRSLKDPTAFGQPDRMTSHDFATADVFDDGGAVHQNDGVGNKTAYLISQGGTFNGRTISGIDGTDGGLTKTGRLYLEVIPRLTSGSEYADLGRVLVGTCDELAASATAGFTTADCTTVRAAVAATELALPPSDPHAAAAEVAAVCPTGNDQQLLARDDDGHDDFHWSLGSLWQRTPDNGTPAYAESGTSSLFAWDPDPDPSTHGDPPVSSATSAAFTVPTGQTTFLNLHHAYLFDYAPATSFARAEYYDGAQVVIEQYDPASGWFPQPLPWVNGPDKNVVSSSGRSFGGDSFGYGSSQVDLTGLAGRQIRVVLKVSGDPTIRYLGWWVDDVRLYSCLPHPPTAPTNLRASAGMTTAVISWDPPADPGVGVDGYRLSSDSGSGDLAAGARSFILNRPAAIGSIISLTPLWHVGGVGGRSGQTARITVYDTATVPRSIVGRARKGRYFHYSCKVIRETGNLTDVVAGMPLLLQRRTSPAKPWRTTATGVMPATGWKVWRVRQSRASYYRVVAPGFDRFFGSRSRPQLIRMR